MKRLDYITATVMLAFSAVVVFGTGGLDFWDDFGPSSRFMPLWVAGATALLSLLLILEAGRSTEEAALPDRSGARRVALTLACIVGFMAAAPWLGFIAATATFVLVLLLGVERRRVLPSLVTAVATASIVQAIFVTWLAIPLPKGVLGL
jgi:putative tricarboxylic transport membrane protein